MFHGFCGNRAEVGKMLKRVQKFFRCSDVGDEEIIEGDDDLVRRQPLSPPNALCPLSGRYLH
jgi:hypothetical protein